MSWIAAAIGGATALVGATSASKSANAQKDASQAQIDLATRMYNDNVGRADQNLAAQRSIFDQTLASQTGQTQQTLEDQLRVAGMTREEQLRLAGLTREEQLRIAGQTRNDLLGVASGYEQSALDSSQQALDATLGYFDPYAQGGTAANNALMVEYGLSPGESQFQTTPGYEFKMNEGLGAVEGSAAAAGSLMSGATMESLMYTGQGIADQEYDDYLMGLTDMTNRGFSASTNMGNAQMNADATRQNIYGNSANMTGAAYNNYGNQAYNAYGNYGANASNAYGNYGNQVYNAYGTQGANDYNAYGMYGSGMASANQNTFNALAGAGSEYQANMNTALANQGNATAAGYMAPSNALMAGIVSGVNMYGYMNTPNPWLRSTVPASSQQAAASGWGVY